MSSNKIFQLIVKTFQLGVLPLMKVGIKLVGLLLRNFRKYILIIKMAKKHKFFLNYL